MVQIEVKFGIEIEIEYEVVGIEADIEHDIEIVVDLLQIVFVTVVKKEGLAYNDIEESGFCLLAVLIVMQLMLDIDLMMTLAYLIFLSYLMGFDWSIMLAMFLFLSTYFELAVTYSSPHI